MDVHTLLCVMFYCDGLCVCICVKVCMHMCMCACVCVCMRVCGEMCIQWDLNYPNKSVQYENVQIL